MLRIVLTVISFSAALSAVYGQTNYCLAKFCGTPNTHIACNNTGAWGPECPTSPAPVLVVMNLSQRNTVIRQHNVRRDNLALGNLPNFPSARQMATIRWSPELARFAALNVRQCVKKHDECHTTNKFLNSGQNLALFDCPNSTPNELLITAIRKWWSERLDTTVADINSFPSDSNGRRIKRFTLMGQAKNWAVGCAAAQFVRNGVRKCLVTCNYATDNVPGRPVYLSGPTALDCATGTNINYNGLCTVDETYNL